MIKPYILLTLDINQDMCLMLGLFWWFLKILDTAVINNEIQFSGRLQPAWCDIADHFCPQFCQDPKTWQSSDYYYMIC